MHVRAGAPSCRRSPDSGTRRWYRRGEDASASGGSTVQDWPSGEVPPFQGGEAGSTPASCSTLRAGAGPGLVPWSARFDAGRSSTMRTRRQGAAPPSQGGPGGFDARRPLHMRAGPESEAVARQATISRGGTCRAHHHGLGARAHLGFASPGSRGRYPSGPPPRGACSGEHPGLAVRDSRVRLPHAPPLRAARRGAVEACTFDSAGFNSRAVHHLGASVASEPGPLPPADAVGLRDAPPHHRDGRKAGRWPIPSAGESVTLRRDYSTAGIQERSWPGS